MLTTTLPPIPPYAPDPQHHHSTPRTLLTTPQWSFHPSRFHPLRRKPSEHDLRAMFYSQRISNRKRRCANPNAFDQSWRRSSVWRPLSVPHDIRKDLQVQGEEQYARKRSRTVAAEGATALFVGDDEFAVRAGLPGTKERSERIDSLAPDVEMEDAPPWITKENSVVLRCTRELRKHCLEDNESAEEDEQVQNQLQTQPDVRQTNLAKANAAQRSARRHSFHATTATTRDLAARRAAVIRIARTRNMSRPEISLRREIFFQEQYLRTHKREGGTRTYRYMATALTRNRRHLLAYKRRVGGWRSLPKDVRQRILELAAQGGDEDTAMVEVGGDEGRDQELRTWKADLAYR